ncbi:unnamed protein product [Rotaria socialis]
MACSKTQSNTNNNNLETYSIFWLDAEVNNEENLAAQKTLRTIINQLRVFDNPDEFMDHVCCIQKGDLTILIVSGQLGRIVVPKMQELMQVLSIYIYCFNKEANIEWSQPYNKVKAVCNKLNELIDVIRSDQKQRSRNEEVLSIDILDRSSTELDGEFLHSQLLIDVLIRMKLNEQDQSELIELLKNEYKGNDSELKLVKEFQENYNSESSISWYTRESFVYRSLNKALRVRNIDMMFLFRTVIRDVYEQLLTNQCGKRITAYRGQIISKQELKKLQKSVGTLVSFNSFLSTSLNRKVAENFVQQSVYLCSSSDHVSVIFEIVADPLVLRDSNENNRRPFAQVDKLSYFGEEEEILFMLGSIFRLNEICHDASSANGTISIIRMTLCGEDDNDLKQLYDHMKNEDNQEETDLLSLADVVYKMAKFDLAEKYYRRWLNELPPNDRTRGALYQRLGMVANAKGDYNTSLDWYQKSLEMNMKNHPSDYVTIGITHNSIGEAHRKKRDHYRALESYDRAVSLFKQAYNGNHSYMAMFYNNIGLNYQEEKKYSEALEFYEKSLAIKKIHLPAEHPALGTTYNNIGIVHFFLNQYDLALDYYNQSLKIRLRSLPAHHPDIAMTYKNMGLVYEDTNDLKQALTFLRKAQAIYEATLSTNHPDVLNNNSVVQRLESKLKAKK